MRLPESLIEGALRIGVGKFTTSLEIEQAAKILANAVNQARQAMVGGVGQHIGSTN
jgi:cysteine desulfurase